MARRVRKAVGFAPRIALCAATVLTCGIAACQSGGGNHGPAISNAVDNQKPLRLPKNLAPRVEPQVQGQFTVTVNPFPGETIGGAAVVLGDCNGDGLLDAFLPMEGHLFVRQPDGTLGAAVVVSTPDPASMASEMMRPGNETAAFVDLDQDGKLDLVIGSKTVVLRKGDGNCGFAAPVPLFQACEGGPPGQLVVMDIDRDGLLDFSCACAREKDPLARLFVARGDGTYEMVTPPPTPQVAKDAGFPAFGTFFDDLDGDGTLDGFFLSDWNLGWFSWGVPGDLPAFKRDDSLTNTIAITDSMSLSPLDFDRDGRIDYFLSGTCWAPICSGSPLLWNAGPRDLYDITEHAGLIGDHPISNWGSFASDFDFDGWTDLLVLRAGASSPSESGLPEIPSLYMNRHDATFAEVGAQVLGEQARVFGIALACGDLTSDGKIGCYAPSSPEILLRNGLTPQGGWLGLELHGTVSGSNGAGARVSLDGEARPLTVVASAQSPTGIQHDGRPLLAVGDRQQASVTVQWPSGLTQHVGPLQVGQYHTITEPQVLAVAPRFGPANGTAEFDVAVDLKAAGAAAATVELVGSGSWKGPAALQADGKLHRTLIAAATPGSARIQVRLDGAALLVRPRVRYE